MITAAQIRTKVHQLTLREISLDAFEEWLTAESWNMHKDSRPESDEAQRLVGKIELALAESDDGRTSEPQLLNQLALLAGWFEMGSFAPLVIAASSTAQVVPFSLQFELSERVDKQFGMELSYTPLPAA